MDLIPATETSIAIEFKGVRIGCVIPHSLGVQFVAADRRLQAMDRSIWPSTRYAVSAARQIAAAARADQHV